jgi:altronate dehydratase large subunit
MTLLVASRDAEGRIWVRRRAAVISTVSCANVVTERLGARHGELAVLAHQHGCGQLGDDMTLTRELLAALASHPNVSVTVLISLGCETNVAHELARSVRQRGGRAHVVGIQACGGVDEAVQQAEGWLRAHETGDVRDAPADSAELRVGVIADEATRRRLPSLVEAICAALARERFSVVTPAEFEVPLRTSGGSGGPMAIPSRWRSEPRETSEVIQLLAAPPSTGVVRVPLGPDFVERMTVMTAMGAQVLVSLMSRPRLAGAALAPTIGVSTNPDLDVLSDLVDVPFQGDDLPGRVLAKLRATVAGQTTGAERLGMRDLALPRLAPCY